MLSITRNSTYLPIGQRSRDTKMADNIIDKHIVVRLSYYLATGFGSGLAKKAPGTCGTVLALTFALVLKIFSIELNLISLAALIIFLTIAGCLSIIICQQNLDEFSDKDPQKIVIDEIAGYFVSICLCPWTYLNLILAFILFRLFDITKPMLVGWADKKEGAIFIMLDDIIAGIYSSLCLLLLNYFINQT